jgi:cell division protein FtsZ
VQLAAHPEAQIIFGAVIDEHMGDALRVTVIATGFSDVALEEPAKAVPNVRRRGEMPMSNGYAEPASAATYEVHEKFDPDAYARWQAFSKSAPPLESDSVPDERNLDVPAFFRRRLRRRS